VCIVFPLAVIAALGAGCAKRQPGYVMVDPKTGQQYTAVQQPQVVAAPTRQQPAQYQSQSFELYGQGGHNVPAQAAPSQQPAAAAADDIPNRGLFTSWRSSYAPAASQRQQPYVVQYQPPTAPPQAQAYVSAQAPGHVVQQPEARGLMSGRTQAPGAYVAPHATYASAPPYAGSSYTLGSGDRLRITVFGQEGLTNSYTVDAGGNVSVPLIGSVPARGITTQQLASRITQRLKQGYVRDPSVSVEVEVHRPFFILGEVTTPGQYPYVANLTVQGAVAIAGGFSPRASKRSAELTRSLPGQAFRSEVPLSTPIKPGDTIVIKERWF
jgi:polysaccharide export outer membrane protein